jgi:4-amino-4-deoxy-L-arabinose transferase-like glycosyltransferase
LTAQDPQHVEPNSSVNFWSRFASNRPEKRTIQASCILFAIVALGLALRLNELDVHGFYVDEVYSAMVANGTADPELAAFDSIRPVYFVLLKLWMNFGTSEWWLRFFSVIFGTANIVLTYVLSSLCAGRRVGLVAAALMALSPMEVHYSQLARMYTLGSFFALLGSIALIKALQTGKNQFVILWVVVRTLMVWTLPLTVVLLGVDIALAVLRERKHQLMKTVAIGFVTVMVLFLCFAWKMPQITSQSEYDSWRYMLSVPQITDAFMMFVNFTSTAVPLQECEGPVEGGGMAIVYTFCILTLLSISVLPAIKQRWLIWCTGWSVFSIMFAYALSQVSASIVITRYMMFASPFTFILIAAGWNELWKPVRMRALAVLSALVYVVIINLNLAHLFLNPVHEDWREISHFVQEHEKPGDSILVWNYHSQYLFGFYYRGSNKIYDIIVKDKLDQSGKPTGAVELDLRGGLPKISGRCWVVMRQAPQGWAMGWESYQLFKKELEAKCKVLELHELKRTDLYLVTEK